MKPLFEGVIMAEKLVTLPERDEMLARLKKINQSPSALEHFYPRLLANAGAELTGAGIAVMLKQALAGYILGGSWVLVYILCAQAPQFIDALVNDLEVARDAKNLLDLSFA
jgi:hypothetical protein